MRLANIRDRHPFARLRLVFLKGQHGGSRCMGVGDEPSIRHISKFKQGRSFKLALSLCSDLALAVTLDGARLIC